MYLGRAGPSKMIELTPLSLSLIEEGAGGGEDGEGTNTAGRIGPSKMSTHSLTLSVLDEPGVGEVALISGVDGNCGMAVAGVVDNTCACLEMEDEWALRTNVEVLRRMVDEC